MEGTSAVTGDLHKPDVCVLTEASQHIQVQAVTDHREVLSTAELSHTTESTTEGGESLLHSPTFDGP